ncbi:hypothetical protein BDR07DRAFT_1404905 [Suillus spraguei]|nr:hypothetical protein BDR07DRAFT_1404905 [Suillus spraguei]
MPAWGHTPGEILNFALYTSVTLHWPLEDYTTMDASHMGYIGCQILFRSRLPRNFLVYGAPSTRERFHQRERVLASTVVAIIRHRTAFRYHVHFHSESSLHSYYHVFHIGHALDIDFSMSDSGILVDNYVIHCSIDTTPCHSSKLKAPPNLHGRPS